MARYRVLESGQCREQMPSRFQSLFSGFGELHSPLSTFEQLYSQTLLDLLQLQSDCRLAISEFARRSSNAAALDDGDEAGDGSEG